MAVWGDDRLHESDQPTAVRVLAMPMPVAVGRLGVVPCGVRGSVRNAHREVAQGCA